MNLRSLDTLNVPQAWRRLLFRMRRFIDVPDRLPFEVMDRLSSHAPTLSSPHHLRPVTTVMASKGTGTVRPFVRLSPYDLLLYQALVDALADDIEAALGSREKVFAYRMGGVTDDDPFSGSPKWFDFIASVRGILQSGRYSHALTLSLIHI